MPDVPSLVPLPVTMNLNAWPTMLLVSSTGPATSGSCVNHQKRGENLSECEPCCKISMQPQVFRVSSANTFSHIPQCDGNFLHRVRCRRNRKCAATWEYECIWSKTTSKCGLILEHARVLFPLTWGCVH